MKQIFRDLTVLLLLISLIVFLWFSKGLLYASGEEGIPFHNIERTLKLVSFLWQDTSGGYAASLVNNRLPYFTFLKIFYDINFPNYLIQAIHFFVIMAIGTISMYFLIRQTVFKDPKYKQENGIYGYAPLVAGIFYLINPFSMTQIWGRSLYMQFFPFALFPLFLLLFILGLNNKNFVYGALGLIISFFLAGSFGNPSYLFSLWLIIFIYLIFYFFSHRNKKDIFFALCFFIFLFVGWILIQVFWLYPLAKLSENQITLALDNYEPNLGSLKGVSKDYPLPALLRLMHYGYFYDGHKFGESYFNFFFKLISWLVPLVSLFSYSLFKKLKHFGFFAPLFLISLFICLGSNFPLGWLFILIFKTFPFFQSFRNPFEKFGIVLTIAYAPFFAMGAVAISSWVGKLFKKVILSYLTLVILLVLIFGVFLWPIWTGQFAGGIKINPWIKVPDYYKSLDNWLNTQKDDGRIIHFPINPADGIRYRWEYSYQGIEPGEYLFGRPSIGKYGQPYKPYYKFLMDRFNKSNPNAYGPDPNFSNSEFKSEYLYQELAKLNVRYIILHYDIDPTLGDFDDPSKIADYLIHQKNINKINSFGRLDIYRVHIPDEIQLIYSPDARINYVKINPTQYSINVISAKNPFELYFLENFDSNWELIVDNKKVENHNKLFSYANKWKINKEGNFQAIMKYKPQDFVDEGMKITKGSVLILSFICFFYLMGKIWKLKKI